MLVSIDHCRGKSILRENSIDRQVVLALKNMFLPLVNPALVQHFMKKGENFYVVSGRVLHSPGMGNVSPWGEVPVTISYSLHGKKEILPGGIEPRLEGGHTFGSGKMNNVPLLLILF